MTCGNEPFDLPQPIILQASSLPADMDLFRMEDAWTVILATKRFVDAAARLKSDGVVFRERECR
nr:double-CXXCG motif protein [Myxococcus sp. AM009]